MSLTKDINWLNRAPCGSKNDVYLFWKSFSSLQNKDLLKAVSNGISKSEMVCSDAVMELLADPILMYVLGLHKTLPSLDEIVRFYKEGAEAHQDGLPFVDLCLYFNKVGDAEKFAREHHLDFKISMIDQTGVDNNSMPYYDDEFSKTWLKLLEKNDEVPMQRLMNSAELLGFALRFATGNKKSVICEMAGRGYLWDSFILMSIFYPADSVTKQLKSAVSKLYDLSYELERFSANDVKINRLKEVEQEPSHCYEQVKRNLREHIDDEFIRSALYTEIRLCLMSAVCSDVGDLAYFAMASDLYEFAVNEPTVLAEFLPAMQKNFFEQAFVVMSDLIKAVLHLCNIFEFDLIEDYISDPNGLIHSLISGWVNLDVIPEEELSLGRSMKGINDIIYTFIGDVTDCSKISRLGGDCKELVLLALRIGEVMFNSKLGERNDSIIFDIIKNKKECQEFVQKFLQKSGNTNPASSLMGKMASSLHRTMLNVNKMMESRRAPFKQCFSSVHTTDVVVSDHIHTAAKFLGRTKDGLKVCDISSSYEDLSTANTHFEETIIAAESDGTSVFLESTSIDSLSIHKEVRDDVVVSINKTAAMYSGKDDCAVGPSTNAHISKTALDRLFELSVCSVSHSVSEKETCAANTDSATRCFISTEEETDVSKSGCSPAQSLARDLDEDSNMSAKGSDATRMRSYSSDLDAENVDIWANGRNARKYNNEPSFAGPIGKVSSGFGGINEECQNVSGGFVDPVPHMHNRGRGGFRRGGYTPHNNADSSYMGVDAAPVQYNAGYVHRGSNYRRGAYVPRGSRDVFN